MFANVTLLEFSIYLTSNHSYMLCGDYYCYFTVHNTMHYAHLMLLCRKCVSSFGLIKRLEL